MPTYQPNIPTGSVPFNQDYLNLQGNYQQLNIAYGVDHSAFSDTTGVPPTGVSGMHKAIHQVPVSTVASNPPNNQPINGYTAVTGYNQVISAQINDGINTDTALFSLTGGNRLQQLTRNFVPIAATNGSSFIAGGIIFQWGFKAVTEGTGSGTVSFPISFSSTTYNVVATPTYTTTGPTTSQPIWIVIDRGPATTKSEFGWTASAGGTAITGFYWQAIGI